MPGARLKITGYARQRRSDLLDLADRSHWTHRHLDWQSTSQWLDGYSGHVLLAWHGDQLVGYLGFSQPIAGWSWIRLLGIRDGRMPGMVVRELWEAAEARCRELEIANVAVLMLTNWLPNYLRERGFDYADDVIAMSQIGGRRPPAPAIPARIRPAESEDLEAMTRIDRLAFEPPWQLSREDMRQALRLSNCVTLATLNDEAVAYQLSTRQDGVGHLARLAVHPACRRKGIASALMHRLLRDFGKRNLTELSVNTQLSNKPSQRLYERFGFYRNGKDIEFWRKRLR